VDEPVVVEGGPVVEGAVVVGAVVLVAGTWHGRVVVTAGALWSGAYCWGAHPKLKSTE
jgi:hypothetical protein